MLAQRWMTGLRTRPKNEHKSEAKASRYANAWEGLRECEARSNPVSKKCSGNRLEKLLRECNLTIMGKLVYIKQENNIIIG